MRHFNRDSLDYEFATKFTAGLVLTGSDVKSLRTTPAQFNGSKIEIINGVPTVFSLTIPPYRFASNTSVDTTTERQLLLNEKEIKELQSYRHQKYMIIPISIFLSHNRFKMEIGIGRKMRKYEKRDKIKNREIKKNLI